MLKHQLTHLYNSLQHFRDRVTRH